VTTIPFHNQSSAPWASLSRIHCHECFVGRHYAEQRPGPVCEQQYSSDKKRRPSGQPPRHGTENQPSDREWSLHCKSASVGRLLLSEKRVIVQAKSGRLFGETDIERSTCEEGCNHESEMSWEHH